LSKHVGIVEGSARPSVQDEHIGDAAEEVKKRTAIFESAPDGLRGCNRIEHLDASDSGEGEFVARAALWPWGILKAMLIPMSACEHSARPSVEWRRS